MLQNKSITPPLTIASSPLSKARTEETLTAAKALDNNRPYLKEIWNKKGSKVDRIRHRLILFLIQYYMNLQIYKKTHYYLVFWIVESFSCVNLCIYSVVEQHFQSSLPYRHSTYCYYYHYLFQLLLLLLLLLLLPPWLPDVVVVLTTTLLHY